MNKQEYINNIRNKLKQVSSLQQEIINLTQEYLSDELNNFQDLLVTSGVDRLLEGVAQDSAIIIDMFEGKTHIYNTDSKDYKQSRLRKVRKALGYTL